MFSFLQQISRIKRIFSLLIISNENKRLIREICCFLNLYEYSSALLAQLCRHLLLQFFSLLTSNLCKVRFI